MQYSKKCLVASAALAVCLSPLSQAETTIAPGHELVMRTVHFADLDLGDALAVQTLYGRIESAAGEVCVPVSSGAPDSLLIAHRCKRQAIAQAVSVVNSAQLTAFHVATTGRAQHLQAR